MGFLDSLGVERERLARPFCLCGLVSPEAHAQFLCGSLLCPAHAFAPSLEVCGGHCRDFYHAPIWRATRSCASLHRHR